MDPAIIHALARITPEEQRLRDGEALDRTLYATGHGFEIEAAKLLRQGQLITIRPHTRFVAFPRHSHDYVEIMYMCTGQTTHLIGGSPVLLQAGELLFLNQRASHAIQRAEVGDVAVNFIILPQFFDFAFQIVGTSNLLGRFLLGTLKTGSSEITHLLCHTADLLPVQNLVESMVWSLLNNEPGARRYSHSSMPLVVRSRSIRYSLPRSLCGISSDSSMTAPPPSTPVIYRSRSRTKEYRRPPKSEWAPGPKPI